jgi:hypothetical protein
LGKDGIDMINYESRDYKEDTLTIFDIAHIKDILEEPTKYDWYGAHLLRLCRKADQRNLAKLAMIYPDIVAAFCIFRYKKIPTQIRGALKNPEYYEDWIPKLMGRVK